MSKWISYGFVFTHLRARAGGNYDFAEEAEETGYLSAQTAPRATSLQCWRQSQIDSDSQTTLEQAQRVEE
jgi:hypothetical protein